MELLHTLCDRLRAGNPVVMATVLRQQGSAPRGAGSKLLADAGGLICGTVGGGLAEGQTLEACRAALARRVCMTLDFNLSGELAARADMICGGHLRILLEPLFPEAATLALFEALRNAMRAQGAVCVTSVLEQNHAPDQRGAPRSLLCDGDCMGAPLPEAVREAALARGGEDPWLYRHADGAEYFVEPWQPPFRLVLAGGGHVSRPTAQVAALAGFAVTVLDDREEFSRPERFPWAEGVRQTPDFLDCFAGLPMNARTCVVIVTRGHVHDAAVLRQALDTQAGFVGMIGSKRKRAEVYAALRGMGVPDAALERVRCPVGLEIYAETPEEIAVSIVAQCIAHRRQPCVSGHTAQ